MSTLWCSSFRSSYSSSATPWSLPSFTAAQVQEKELEVWCYLLKKQRNSSLSIIRRDTSGKSQEESCQIGCSGYYDFRHVLVPSPGEATPTTTSEIIHFINFLPSSRWLSLSSRQHSNSRSGSQWTSSGSTCLHIPTPWSTLSFTSPSTRISKSPSKSSSAAAMKLSLTSTPGTVSTHHPLPACW